MSDKTYLGTTLEGLCSNKKILGTTRLLDGTNDHIGEFRILYPHDAPPIRFVQNIKNPDEELTFFLMMPDERYKKIIFASGCMHVVYDGTNVAVSSDDRKLGLYYTSSPRMQRAGRKRRQSKRQSNRRQSKRQYNRRQSKRQSNRRQSNRR